MVGLEQMTNFAHMKTATNRIEITLRETTKNASMAYYLGDKHGQQIVYSRAEMIKAFNDLITPYMHGDWNGVVFEVTATRKEGRHGRKEN